MINVKINSQNLVYAVCTLLLYEKGGNLERFLREIANLWNVHNPQLPEVLYDTSCDLFMMSYLQYIKTVMFLKYSYIGFKILDKNSYVPNWVADIFESLLLNLLLSFNTMNKCNSWIYLEILPHLSEVIT